MNIRLRKHRKRADLSQAEVASCLSYSVSGYSKIERGETKLLAEDAVKLASLYGMTLEELLGQDAPGVVGPDDKIKKFMERLNELMGDL
jgi:transcriptional regulator with XRE-family HTH domain